MKGHSACVPVMVVLLLACLLACGCSRAPGPLDAITPTQPAQAPPIVGAWLSLPHDPDGIQDLYVFKESGRCDATVVSGSPGVTLPYEVYLQGRWEETSENRYLLAGEEITHHFVNDTHSTTTVRDVLLYDPPSDRLYRDRDPAHPLERISSEATIPPGMNVSIPWD